MSVPLYIAGGRIAEARLGITKVRRVAGQDVRNPEGQGPPVCQPWCTGDKAGEQRLEAMNFTISLITAF